MLLAYTKTANIAEMLRSDLPDDPYLAADLVRYFPPPLRERFPDEILRHRLRREIIATQLVNQMVNLSGISFDHRMTEETGASVVDITRAWVAARDIFDLADLWDEIDALAGTSTLDDAARAVPRAAADGRARARCGCCATAARRSTSAPTVAEFRAASPTLAGRLDELPAGPHRASGVRARGGAAGRRRARGPRPAQSAVWPLLHTGFDVVELAERGGSPSAERGRRVLAGVRAARPEWLWDGDRRAAAHRPLADPGPRRRCATTC